MAVPRLPLGMTAGGNEKTTQIRVSWAQVIELPAADAPGVIEKPVTALLGLNAKVQFTPVGAAPPVEVIVIGN